MVGGDLGAKGENKDAKERKLKYNKLKESLSDWALVYCK